MSTIAQWQDDEKWQGESEEFGIDHSEPEWQPFPEGFFKAFTMSGRSAGHGFSCYRCKLGIPYDAPNEVRHCGTVSELDTSVELPVHKLGSFKHYRCFTPDQKRVLEMMIAATPEAVVHADMLAPTPTLFERIRKRVVTLCGR